MQDNEKYFAHFTTALIGAIMLMLALPTHAAKLYKVVDENGNITYTDVKPESDATVVEETAPASSVDEGDQNLLDTLAEDKPIVLYSVPGCAACDMVRTYLESKKFPFSEINVQDDVDSQQEMKAAVGSLSVPTVTVDGRKLTGFNASALDAVLEVAGYPVNPESPGIETATSRQGGGKASPEEPTNEDTSEGDTQEQEEELPNE